MADTSKPIESLRTLYKLYHEARKIFNGRRWLVESGDVLDKEVHRLGRRAATLSLEIEQAKVDLYATGYDVPDAWVAVEPIGTLLTERADKPNQRFVSLTAPEGEAVDKVLRSIHNATLKLEATVENPRKPSGRDPTGTVKPKESAKLIVPWWHDKTEPKPEEFCIGLLIGTARELDWAIFRDQRTVDPHFRQLQKFGRERRLWIVKLTRTCYHVSFTDIGTFSAAKQRFDNMQNAMKKPAKNTESKAPKNANDAPMPRE
jgi:hypothetical protein